VLPYRPTPKRHLRFVRLLVAKQRVSGMCEQQVKPKANRQASEGHPKPRVTQIKVPQRTDNMQRSFTESPTGLVVSLLAALFHTQPASAQIHFCNATPLNISVAVTYRADPQSTSDFSFNAMGWFDISAHKCKTVSQNTTSFYFFGWYALNRSEKFTWEGKIPESTYCVTDKKFHHKPVSKPPCEDGFYPAIFTTAVTGELTEKTVRLNISPEDYDRRHWPRPTATRLSSQRERCARDFASWPAAAVACETGDMFHAFMVRGQAREKNDPIGALEDYEKAQVAVQN
jgi:uncharacterized membrane protein